MLDDLLRLGIAREFIVIIIAALPIFELRGAIPVGINIFHLPWYYTLAIAVIGNMLPIPFILLFLDRITRLLRRAPVLRRGIDWWFERTEKRSVTVRKYGAVGLAVFVGIPLPITGAWTGALLATFLRLPFWRSLVAILAGVLVAGAIVTAIAYFGLKVLGIG